MEAGETSTNCHILPDVVDYKDRYSKGGRGLKNYPSCLLARLAAAVVVGQASDLGYS